MKKASFRQAQRVLQVVGEQGLTGRQLQQLFVSGILTDVLEAAKLDGFSKVNRDAVRVAVGLPKLIPDPVVTELPGIVLPDPSVTLGDRIAAGGYDWFNDDITPARFPLTLPAGPAPLATVWFQRDMQAGEVEQWTATTEWEVALIDDTLAVGSHAEYRELQRQFPIIALGSSAVVDGRRHVPYLYGHDTRRYLPLDWYDFSFRDGCRFLLRKKPLVA